MIEKFYKNCDIFITGATGAIGLAVIEKLLRSCSVRKIFILLREKDGCSVDQRLEKIKNSRFFQVLRDTKPNALAKLLAIPGSVELPILGISENHLRALEDVSIIFHAATTAHWNAPLRHALNVNVRGTLEVLKFAETLENLKMFMFVSAFHANPNVKFIEDKIYPGPGIDWRTCVKLLKVKCFENVSDALTHKILEGFPNTFLFTKNLAERVVDDFRHRIPVAIFRHSIVVQAVREPEAGFPTSIMRFNGIFALGGTGLLKTICCANDVNLDITPIDLGSKTLLIHAVIAHQRHKKEEGRTTKIFTFSSSKFNQTTFKEIFDLMQENSVWSAVPFEKNLLIPWIRLSSHQFVYKLLLIWFQLLPAIVVDGFLAVSGRKPVLLKIQRMLHEAFSHNRFLFFNNYGSSGISNVEDVIDMTEGTEFSISPDLRTFESSVSTVDNLINMMRKVREVLMNENDDSLSQCRIAWRAKEFYYNGVRLVIGAITLRALFLSVISYIDRNYGYN